MTSFVSIASFIAQLERLSEGFEDLHEQILVTHQDVRNLNDIMLRSESRGQELLDETKKAVAQLWQFNQDYSGCD